MSLATIKTTCTMDCPDTCTLDVSVENNKIVKIDGNKNNPVTNGYICGKISKFDKKVYHKDRVLFPMKLLLNYRLNFNCFKITRIHLIHPQKYLMW